MKGTLLTLALLSLIVCDNSGARADPLAPQVADLTEEEKGFSDFIGEYHQGLIDCLNGESLCFAIPFAITQAALDKIQDSKVESNVKQCLGLVYGNPATPDIRKAVCSDAFAIYKSILK